MDIPEVPLPPMNFSQYATHISDTTEYNKLGLGQRIKAWLTYKFTGFGKNAQGKAEALYENMHAAVTEINESTDETGKNSKLIKIALQYAKALGAGTKAKGKDYYSAFLAKLETNETIKNIALLHLPKLPAESAMKIEPHTYSVETHKDAQVEQEKPSELETHTEPQPAESPEEKKIPEPPPAPPPPPGPPPAPQPPPGPGPKTTPSTAGRANLLADIERGKVLKRVDTSKKTESPPETSPAPSSTTGKATEAPKKSGSPAAAKAPQPAGMVGDELARRLATRGKVSTGPQETFGAKGAMPAPSEKPVEKPAEETSEEREERVAASIAKAQEDKARLEAIMKLPVDAPVRRMMEPKWGPQTATATQPADLKNFSFGAKPSTEAKINLIFDKTKELKFVPENSEEAQEANMQTKKEYFRAAKSILMDKENSKAIIQGIFDKLRTDKALTFLFLADTILKGEGISIKERGQFDITQERKDSNRELILNLVRQLRIENQDVREYIDKNKEGLPDLYKEYEKPVVPPREPKTGS